MTTAPKGIVKQIKTKAAKEAKANFTFRLNIEMMDTFKSKCEKNDIPMAAVLDSLIKYFIEND